MKPLSFIVLFMILTASKSFGDGVEYEQRRKHFHRCDGTQVCKKLSPSHVCCFGGYCRNISGDPLNCGKCGKICDQGKKCCSGKCADVKKDRRNCGICGKSCLPDESCSAGLCGYA